jgi:hypothetical protein
MKSAVDPVHHQVRSNKKNGGLQPERQLRQRPVPVIVELDQSLGSGDPEQHSGSQDQQSDTQITCKERNDEPVAEVSEQLALAPPGLARVASRIEGQDRESGAKRYGYRQDLKERDPDTVNDRCALLEHDLQTPPPARDYRRRYQARQLRCRERGRFNRAVCRASGRQGEACCEPSPRRQVARLGIAGRAEGKPDLEAVKEVVRTRGCRQRCGESAKRLCCKGGFTPPIYGGAQALIKSIS